MADAALPPSLATPQDLATWLGQEISADSDVRRAQRLLDVASARARRRCGQTWINEDNTIGDVPIEVSGVVLQAVARVYVNAEGLTAEGDADYNFQRGGDAAEAGNIYFTEDEEATLADYRPTDDGHPRVAGLFTISTTRGIDPIFYPGGEVDPSYAQTDPFLEGWPGVRW